MREKHTAAQVRASIAGGLGVPSDEIIHRGFGIVHRGFDILFDAGAGRPRCVALSKLSTADTDIHHLLSNSDAAAVEAELVFAIYPDKTDTNEECLAKAREMAPLYPNVKIVAYVQIRADSPPQLCV